jgi:hypothetical protein
MQMETFEKVLLDTRGTICIAVKIHVYAGLINPSTKLT